MKKKASYKDYFVFCFWFIAIFGVSYTLLYSFGLVPKEVDSEGRETFLDRMRQNAIEAVSNDTVTDVAGAGEEPAHLKIAQAGVDVVIQNPNTTDPVLLDEYLKKGIVRYPGSGLLGSGNVLLFGHSSHLKTVNNPNFKALNNIENLKEGDEVRVQSAESDDVFVYKVTSVKMAPASEIKIDFSQGTNMLTIATCNNFGAKEDRYVVEAQFDRKEAAI